MCGRYALYAATEELIEALGIARDATAPPLQPRYNIAPTQDVPVVLFERGMRRLRVVRWGLVPAQWSAPDERRPPLINARAETIAARPVFRSAFARTRCIVPASGYFEWRTEGRVRQPYYFTLRSGAPLALAGVYDLWQRGDLPPVVSCAIVTVPPNPLNARLHDRMPAVLGACDPGDAIRLWLDPATPRARLADLLRPFAGAAMVMHSVTPRMNHYAYDEPGAVAPLSPTPRAHAATDAPQTEFKFSG